MNKATYVTYGDAIKINQEGVEKDPSTNTEPKPTEETTNQETPKSSTNE